MSIEAENLFPTRMDAYAKGGLGYLIVKNTSDAPVTEGLLKANLPGYTQSAVDTRFDTIEPGKEARIPIRLVLDKGALSAQQDNQPAVLTLELSYEAEEFSLSDKRSKALVVYNKNAVSWSTPDSVAAFVTPQSSHIQSIAKEIASALPEAQASHPSLDQPRSSQRSPTRG